MRPKLQCPECRTVICFNCSKLWHGYFSKCHTADAEQEEKYREWEATRDVQKCPKCKMRIEKTEGCNHMTCSSCRYEFCWICRGKYLSEAHFSDWNVFGCPGGQFNSNARSLANCNGACKWMPLWIRRLLLLLVVLPLVLLVVA